jgi:hypothetical protein
MSRRVRRLRRSGRWGFSSPDFSGERRQGRHTPESGAAERSSSLILRLTVAGVPLVQKLAGPLHLPKVNAEAVR